MKVFVLLCTAPNYRLFENRKYVIVTFLVRFSGKSDEIGRAGYGLQFYAAKC